MDRKNKERHAVAEPELYRIESKCLTYVGLQKKKCGSGSDQGSCVDV